MPWLRAHPRRMAMLALFAIAVQALAAFGHTHLPHGGVASRQSVAAIASQMVSSVAVVADDAGTAQAKLPAGIDPDVACAICLAGHLVASAVTSAAPTLVLPVAYLLLGPPRTVAVEAGRTEPFAFWSRGPPAI